MENLPVPPVPPVPNRDWKPDWLKAGITENGIPKTDPPEASPPLAANGQTHALSDGGERAETSRSVEPQSRPIDPLTIPSDPIDAYRAIRSAGCQIHLVVDETGAKRVRVTGPESSIAAVRPIIVAHREAMLAMVTPAVGVTPFSEEELAERARARTPAETALMWLIDLNVTIAVVAASPSAAGPSQDLSGDVTGDFAGWSAWLDGAVRLGLDRDIGSTSGLIRGGKWMPVRSTAKALLNLLVTRWNALSDEARKSLVLDIKAFWMACGASRDNPLPSRSWRAKDYEWPKGR